MAALFGDAAVRQDDDAICRADRLQTVGDNDEGFVPGQGMKPGLHCGFIDWVQSRGGLVQQDDGGRP